MQSIADVVNYVRDRHASHITVKDLACIAGISPTLLERRMRRLLGVAPIQLVQRVRVEEAAYRLIATDDTIREIAIACGFFDQPSMTRHMKHMLGITPGRLRRSTEA